MNLEIIEKSGSEDKARAVFRLLSRNDTRSTQKMTEEEHLQEVIDSLKDALEKDLRKLEGKSIDDDYEVLYPLYMIAVANKAEEFKGNTSGYRQLCCLPRFALGLAMASRVWRHYRHAVWFRIATLKSMAEVHGGVSETSIIIGEGSNEDT
jgi:DNA-binding protein Fis